MSFRRKTVRIGSKNSICCYVCPHACPLIAISIIIDNYHNIQCFVGANGLSIAFGTYSVPTLGSDSCEWNSVANNCLHSRGRHFQIEITIIFITGFHMLWKNIWISYLLQYLYKIFVFQTIFCFWIQFHYIVDY